MCLRPDKLIFAIRIFISDYLGETFVTLPPFDIGRCFADSDRYKPLIMILSPGSDPLSAIKSFTPSEPHDQPTSVTYLSLGQGQGPAAEMAILEAAETGGWIVLQNCHLAAEWMSRLVILWEDEILSTKSGTVNVHRAFRLWLTTFATNNFPSQLLQSGIKISVESPRGLRAILNSVYRAPPLNDLAFYAPEDYDHCKLQFRKLIYGLAFFHGVLLERRHYGSIGWNDVYDFNRTDLTISLHQLKEILLKPEEVFNLDAMMKAISYLVIECNYGGRVTDPYDRRLLRNLLAKRFNIDVASVENYSLSETGSYKVPVSLGLAEVLDCIKMMPMMPFPDSLGLHDNAAILKDMTDTQKLLQGVLVTQPYTSTSDGGKNASGESVDASANVIERVNEMVDNLPEIFDEAKINSKFPIKYEDSLTTILRLETARCNKLLSTIHGSLRELKGALTGEIVMSVEAEQTFESVFKNQLPVPWKKVSYPTEKTLDEYLDDLSRRVDFYTLWVNAEPAKPPFNFWISGFFFPHSFLTGIKQNFARKKSLSVDLVVFKFVFLEHTQVTPYASVDSQDDELSVVIYGLYLEGGRWDSSAKLLKESKAKIHQEALPPIRLIPTVKPDGEAIRKDDRGHFMYECPVYRTKSRRGDVDQSTGTTSNFVMTIDLPSDKNQEHWIDRGVAAIAQT